MAAVGSRAYASEAVARSLRGKRCDVKSLAFQTLMLLGLLVSLALLVTLLAEVVSGGIGVLLDRGVGFLRTPLSTLPQLAGVSQGLIGSALLMAFVVAIAFPLGIGAAVYLEEYASGSRLSRLIDVNIRNLAGVPSIVYGILGLAILVEAMVSVSGGRSIIAGGVTLAILVLPIVIITTAEAIRAVPQSIREAGYGVGATRWEVTSRLVLPAAAPGILTGTVLSLSRALGETAPLLMVGAVTGFLATGSATVLEQLRGAFTALPVIVYAWASEPSPAFRDLNSAAIIVLLAFILTANAVAIVLRNRYERKW